MASTLTELCRQIQTLIEKLEDEIKKNIIDCHKLLTSNEATEIKLVLEKARDYHYKEILDFLREVVINLRKIIFHEEKIRSLKDENSITPEELKRYSHVQRQVNRVSKTDEVVVTKREKRRVASEVSLESLEAWEMYLEKKAEEEEKTIQVEKSTIPKRKSRGNRKKKKFVSSTFNNFLDYKNPSRKLNSILEDAPEQEFTERPTNDEIKEIDRITSDEENSRNQSELCNRPLQENTADGLSSTTGSDSEDENVDKEKYHEIDDIENRKFPVLNMVESLNEEYFFQGDTKPKIIDVVLKKKEG